MARFIHLRICFVVVLTAVSQQLFAVNYVKLSNASSCSLLTCSPGEELYSAFGHSALRVKDDSLGIDLVFNYGTFNFNTPNFYLKFINGDLNYMLAVSVYENFILNYGYSKRGVVETELILSHKQKQELWNLLLDNSQPENRYYRYDFFFDNCATRIRDIVFKATDHQGIEANTTETFRSYLHKYVDKSGWTAQGIDLLLGMKTDKTITKSQTAFLPDYLQSYFLERGIVSEPVEILKCKIPKTSNSAFSPLFAGILVCFLSVISLILYHFMKPISITIDNIILISCWLLGDLLIFLWFFTKHTVTQNNLNILWASPLLIFTIVFSLCGNAKLLRITSIVNSATNIAFFVLALINIQYFPAIAYLFSLAIIAIHLKYILAK